MLDDHAPSVPASDIDILPASWVACRSAPEPDLGEARLIRAAGYGRFSDRRQHETSIERQQEENRNYCVAMGWEMAFEWADRAHGGSFIAGRDGLLAMLEAARAGAFDRLVLEEIDRLGRELGILATVHSELTSLGIEVHTTQQRRRIDVADVAFRGLQAQETKSLFLYRTQKAKETMASRGLFPTGPCWGYLAGGAPGVIVVDQQVKPIIVMIYDLRVAGIAYHSIAVLLNRRGIRTAKGRSWCGGLVRSVVSNPRYGGTLVYKQRRYKKVTSAGKSTKWMRPRSEWIVRSVPGAGIVSREVWEIAQSKPRIAGRRREAAKYLLSQKMACHACGGPLGILTAAGRTHVQCYGHVKKRSCDNDRTFLFPEVEKAALGIVRGLLSDHHLQLAYAEAFDGERRRLAEQTLRDRNALETRLQAVKGYIKSSFEKSHDGGFDQESYSEMRRDWSEEARDIRNSLAVLPSVRPVEMVAPDRLATLQQAFDLVVTRAPFQPRDEAEFRFHAAFRDLVEKVTIVPDAAGKGFRLRLRSTLPSLLRGVAGDAADGVDRIEIEGGWRPGRTRAPLRGKRLAAIEAAAAAGTFDVGDEVWELIRPLVPDAVYRPQGKGRLACVRFVVDAMFFVLRTGCPWDNLIDRYGPPKYVLGAIRRLAYHGGWERIVERLQADCPTALEGVDMDAMSRFRRQGYVPRAKHVDLVRGEAGGADPDAGR